MKPIAWSCWNEDMPSAIITFTEPDKYGWQSIKPLYTTPQTKPLSVEEIEGAFYKKCWYYDADEKFDYYGFAREIEERHGIK